MTTAISSTLYTSRHLWVQPLGKHLRKETDGADITLVTIYDKFDQANITDKELKALMKKNGLL